MPSSRPRESSAGAEGTESLRFDSTPHDRIPDSRKESVVRPKAPARSEKRLVSNSWVALNILRNIVRVKHIWNPSGGLRGGEFFLQELLETGVPPQCFEVRGSLDV